MNKKSKYERFDKEQWKEINKEKDVAFGDRLMMRRKHLGLTQSELAEIAGVSDNQISNIENGKSFPKFNNFLMLCDALDCNADYLLSGIVKNTVSEQIIEMIATLSLEEQKTLWILLDKYIHRDDAITIDI